MKADQVLVVDDDSEAVVSIIRALKGAGFSSALHAASTAEKAKQIQAETKPSAAVVDLSLEPTRGVESGFELISDLISADPSLRIIVLTGHGSLEYGIRSMRVGAANFLEKPASIEHLKILLEDALQQSHFRRELMKGQKEQTERSLEEKLAGSSEFAQNLRKEIAYLATVQQSLLISGETGSGKSYLARVIHEEGPRADKPFFIFQPTYSNLDLAMSALFGHKKGAFTGATADKAGLFELAGEGTIFIDEVDELPHDLQVALLGVLQRKEFTPVGGAKVLQSKARVICATNREPSDAVSEGKLRQDFFHRIAHGKLALIPLRERSEDVEALAQRILMEVSAREQLTVSGFSEDAKALLLSYSWPGNIRELTATIESALFRAAFEQAPVISKSHIPIEGELDSAAEAKDFRSAVDAYQVKLIKEALASCGGNQVQAASQLGLDRSSMRRIMKRHELL